MKGEKMKTNFNNFKYLNQCGVTYANRDNLQFNFETMTALVTLKADQSQDKYGQLKVLTNDLENLSKAFKVVLCLNKKSFQWSLTKTQDAGLIEDKIRALSKIYPLYGYTSEQVKSQWLRTYDEQVLDFESYLKECQGAQVVQDKLYKIKNDLRRGVFSMPRDESIKAALKIDFTDKKNSYRNLASDFFNQCDNFNLKYLDFLKSKVEAVPAFEISLEQIKVTTKMLLIADTLGFILPESSHAIIEARSKQVFEKIG